MCIRDSTTKEGKIIKAMSALLGEMAEVSESVDEDLSRAYDQINDLSDEPVSYTHLLFNTNFRHLIPSLGPCGRNFVVTW